MHVRLDQSGRQGPRRRSCPIHHRTESLQRALRIASPVALHRGVIGTVEVEPCANHLPDEPEPGRGGAIDEVSADVVDGPAEAQRRCLPLLSSETFQVVKQLPTLLVHRAPDLISIVHVCLVRRSDGPRHRSRPQPPGRNTSWTLPSKTILSVWTLSSIQRATVTGTAASDRASGSSTCRMPRSTSRSEVLGHPYCCMQRPWTPGHSSPWRPN
jgi:hypothetical protein